jgi:FkbM family methyltransferase
LDIIAGECCGNPFNEKYHNITRIDMNFRKLVWRIYVNVGLKLTAFPLLRLKLGNRSLGSSIDGIVRKLFSETIPNPLTVYDLTVYWPSRYSAGPELVLESYESETLFLWQSLIQNSLTVVDVGANIGLYSLIAARLVGKDGNVYAFEPEEDNYKLFLKNIEVNGFGGIISPIKKAVIDKIGNVRFFSGDRDSGESSIFQTPGAGNNETMVEAISLDEFFSKKNWPPVHVIKMDIEGAEKLALDGMKNLLEKNSSVKLIMEFYPKAQVAAGVTPRELFNTLLSVGFQKFSVINKVLKPLNIPEDIPALTKMTGNGYANIICEK